MQKCPFKNKSYMLCLSEKGTFPDPDLYVLTAFNLRYNENVNQKFKKAKK